MQIYPSILETSSQAFGDQFERVLPYFSHFQLDVADGKLVHNTTIPIKDIETVLTKKKAELAGKTFEFHLMVADYDTEVITINHLPEYIRVSRILIHLSAYSQRLKLPTTSLPLGIVLNPEDEIQTHWQTIQQFPSVQLMTIHPGMQGTAFMPEALTKIDQLHTLGFSGDIILDGGINDKSLSKIMHREHLPTAVCPGSYFTADVEKRLRKLEKISER